MGVKPGGDETSHVERAAGNVETAQDLYFYARAMRLLEGEKEDGKTSLWTSEAFIRFAGIAFGGAVAAAVLIFSQFFSIASNSISLMEKNRTELERSIGKLSDESAVVAETLKSTETKLGEASAEIQARAADLGRANAQIEEAKASLDQLQARIAVERLGGTVLRMCERSLLEPLFRLISREYVLPIQGDPVEISLHLYLLNDGELPYTLFARTAGGPRYALRRAEVGAWSVDESTITLQLKIHDRVVEALRFDRGEFESFTLAETKAGSICASSRGRRWCFPSQDCSR